MDLSGWRSTTAAVAPTAATKILLTRAEAEDDLDPATEWGPDAIYVLNQAAAWARRLPDPAAIDALVSVIGSSASTAQWCGHAVTAYDVCAMLNHKPLFQGFTPPWIYEDDDERGANVWEEWAAAGVGMTTATPDVGVIYALDAYEYARYCVGTPDEPRLSCTDINMGVQNVNFALSVAVTAWCRAHAVLGTLTFLDLLIAAPTLGIDFSHFRAYHWTC
jgi:hypothetical protein